MPSPIFLWERGGRGCLSFLSVLFNFCKLRFSETHTLTLSLVRGKGIAAVRHLSLATVNGLIAKYTDSRGLGFSGEPGVNVLKLNLALDRLTGGTP